MAVSWQGAPLLTRLLSASVAAATQAGGVIRDIMQKGDLAIVTKESVKDLQTKADREAQRCIISSLNRSFPSITIIGEEGEAETSAGEGGVFDATSGALLDLSCPATLASLTEEEVVVWVDPLDGTAEYTQGLLDHVTVLVGIASGGRAVAGVIHQPYFNYQNPGSEMGRTVWGCVGGGVGGMDITPPPPGRLVVTTTRSHSSATVNDAIAAVAPDEVVRVGGAGHKVMLLLEGRAHLYVFASPGCKKWDTCAPQAVLEAAGGVMTDIQGAPIPYHATAPHRNASGVLASAAGQDHLSHAAKIPQHVKDNLQA